VLRSDVHQRADNLVDAVEFLQNELLLSRDSSAAEQQTAINNNNTWGTATPPCWGYAKSQQYNIANLRTPANCGVWNYTPVGPI